VKPGARRPPFSGVVFLNLSSNMFTRTRNYYHGLKKLGVDCQWFDISSLGNLKAISQELKVFRKTGYKVVVTSPSHIIVLWFFLLFRLRPVLDAGWPLIDGVIVSRKQTGILGLKAILVDNFSFLFSSLILIESQSQLNRCRRLFPFYRKKFFVLMTGVDENRFENTEPTENHFETDSRGIFQVLFRGGPQDEAGLDVLQKGLLDGILDNRIKFKIISRGFNSAKLPSSVETISELVPDEYLSQAFNESDLVLGQLSNHKRVGWTLPHKFFESAYFGKPYLVSRQGEMVSLIDKGVVFGFDAGDAVALFKKIVEISSRPELTKASGGLLKDWYLKNASQAVLSRRFFEILSGD
jgi:glycosyltransferase involved in cell wall biosynthesis